MSIEASGLIWISGRGSSDGLWVWHETSEYALKAVKESAMEAFTASSPSSKLWKQPWCSSLIFYSFIQLIGLSLHIQITINKTQIKDPIHCSVLHQKLFPSNFEAIERVLELPRYGSGLADHFVIGETIKRWFWMIIFSSRWFNQTQKNFIENWKGLKGRENYVAYF